MLKAYTRHLILLFAVGFMWGYVAKTIIGHYYYIGWDDPQIVTVFPYKDLNTVQIAPPEALQTIETEQIETH